MGAALTVQGRNFFEVLFSPNALPSDATQFFKDGMGEICDALFSEDLALILSNPSQLISFLEHNIETQRVGEILSFTHSLLDIAVTRRSCGPPHTHTALRLAHCVLRAVFQSCYGDKLLLLQHANKDGIAFRLSELAVTYATQVAVTGETCRVHSEVVLLLLTFASTPLHHSAEASEMQDDIFIRHILSMDALPALCRTLMGHVLSWGNDVMPNTEYYYVHGYQPKLLNLYNLFGAVRKEQCIEIRYVVGRGSLQLLLALMYFGRGRENDANLAIAALHSWSDGAEVSFEALISATRSKLLRAPEMALVLYLFMQESPEFLRIVMGSYSEALLDTTVGMLHCCHVCDEPAKLNLMCTNLLILSQDAGFNTLAQHQQTTAPWIKERYIASISVGSLLLVCLSRIVSRAYLRENHDSVAAIAVGIMANMAPFVTRVHGYAAQRLVFLLTALLKRMARLNDRIAACADDYGAIAQLQACSQTASIVCEIIYSIINHATQHNYTLIYELLYHRPMITVPPCREGCANVAEALEPTLKIISFYETEIAAEVRRQSVEEIMRVIRVVTHKEGSTFALVTGGSGSQGADPACAAGPQTSVPCNHSNEVALTGGCDELVYQYRESPNSYSFFAVCLWGCVVSTGPGGAQSGIGIAWADERHKFALLQEAP